MARQDLNLGTNSNDGTGDKLRPAMKKVNDNFIELYSRTGGDGSQSNIGLSGNVLSSVGNLTITTNNTGSINLEDVVNLNDALNLVGPLRINTSESPTGFDLIVGGNVKVHGNTILGDSVGEDRITLNSAIASPILPALDATYDLGTPSLKFRNVYADTLNSTNMLISNVTLTGGTINNTLIGYVTPADGKFSNITVTGDSTLGNLLIRNNMISATDTNGNVELRPNGTGNVFVSTKFIVGVGTDTGDEVQVNGDAVINGLLTGNEVQVNGVLTVGNFQITDNMITATNSNGDVELVSNGAGKVIVSSKLMVGAGVDTGEAAQVNGDTIINGTLTVTGNVVLDTGTVSGDKTIVTFVIDGGLGDVISTGSKKYLGPMNFSGTITSATLLSSLVGDIEIEIRKCSYADFDAGATHPVAGDKITASAPLTLTSAAKSQDTTLTGWTTSFSTGDIFEFVVNSATTITWVEITLAVTKV